MKYTAYKKPEDTGFILPAVLSAILAFIILSGALLTIIETNLFQVNRNAQSQQAFNIAEAGANYYLWHLSHNSTDFKDGKTTPSSPDPSLGYGPYIHDYINDNGKKTGTYTLWVKPDGNGSTIATVRSIGQVDGTTVKRTVEARIGAASFASYGLVADTALWFGNTESADGPVHSNVGIEMNGANSSDVTSANTTYVPPPGFDGSGSSHPGVWCDGSVVTPVNCNTRSKADWKYPAPSVDFNQVTSSLCTLKKQAFSSDSSTSSLANLSNACSQVPTTRTDAYLPRRSSTYNIARGYLIELNSSGTTYNLYNVNGENDQAAPYTSALTLQAVATGISIPANSVIFTEDNVWVRTNPTFNGRVTIGAGRLASSSQAANAVIADDLVYNSKNGSNVIGIVAEDSVILAPYAIPASGNFNFEVDAGIIAQSGHVWYPSKYRTNSSKCTRGWVGSGQNFLFYGSIATRQTWTWTWIWSGGCSGDAANGGSNGWISGVLNNTTQYDYNLLYAPPPSFPITTSYNILSWREVLTTP